MFTFVQQLRMGPMGLSWDSEPAGRGARTEQASGVVLDLAGASEASAGDSDEGDWGGSKNGMINQEI